MMNEEFQSKLAVCSEILFILLPLIIICFFLFLQNRTDEILFQSDWTFATIIFFGQSIVKFISGLLKSKREFKWQMISIIISSIIVLGLIPSTVILIQLLSTSTPNIKLIIIQYAFLILSIGVYYYFGTAGQSYLDEAS